MKSATTPLPTSSQLTRIIGASASNPLARVRFKRRCQAPHERCQPADDEPAPEAGPRSSGEGTRGKHSGYHSGNIGHRIGVHRRLGFYPFDARLLRKGL